MSAIGFWAPHLYACGSASPGARLVLINRRWVWMTDQKPFAVRQREQKQASAKRRYIMHWTRELRYGLVEEMRSMLVFRGPCEEYDQDCQRTGDAAYALCAPYKEIAIQLGCSAQRAHDIDMERSRCVMEATAGRTP